MAKFIVEKKYTVRYYQSNGQGFMPTVEDLETFDTWKEARAYIRKWEKENPCCGASVEIREDETVISAL